LASRTCKELADYLHDIMQQIQL